MADPVFALSPISARGSLPTEADYDAIREAFMETARGRWFLTEYAKRNRNADTNLVLDAVSRLEATLAAQKQEQQQPDRTPEIIAAIGALVIEARSEAAVLLSVRDAPDADSPALRGVRVLREMAWTLRESGSDGRIPDLLGKQADAIEEGLKAAIDDTARDHVLSVFDRLAGDIEAFSLGAPTASPAAHAQTSAAAGPDTLPETATAAPEAAAADASLAGTAAFSDTVELDDPQAAELQAVADAIAGDGLPDEIEDVHAQLEAPANLAPAASQPPPGYVTIEAVNADDADLIWDEPAQAANADGTGSNAAAAIDQALPVSTAPAPMAVTVSLPPTPTATTSVDGIAAREAAIIQRIEEPAPLPVREEAVVTLAKPAGLSLGEQLLETGVIARPDAPRSDPLAPFKRMTQAERIAFFS